VRFFCTYFDSNYLPRGLALYRSLRRHCPSFRLWVLCMDRACYDTLAALALPEVTPVALEAFERGDEALLAAKRNRSTVEYYFTCTPSLALYVLARWPEVDVVTYLDADLFFFASPAPLEAELADGSIAIIAHRFPPEQRDRERYGIYNVGYLSFRRDERGLACLRWWRERCIEWCYDQAEEGRFADQKYLDDWPGRFAGTVVLQHPGANLAPWNLAGHALVEEHGEVRVDGQPLLFYHFHGFRQLNHWLFDHSLDEYGVIPSDLVLHRIYMPYIRELLKVGHAGAIERGAVGRRWMPALLRKLGWMLRAGNGLLQRRYLFVRGGRLVHPRLGQPLIEEGERHPLC
jgi:hypothetical protein